MEETCANAWVCYNQSAIVTRQPSYLCCINFTAFTAGDTVMVYEGRDATSGRKITTVKGLLNRSVSFNFVSPLLCERGIYAAISNVKAEYTITFRPVEYEELRRE